jgi:hypothetical protein
VYEAPARTRAAVRRFAPDVDARRRRRRRARPAAPRPGSWEPKRTFRGSRVVGLGLAVVVLIAGGYTLFAALGGGVLGAASSRRTVSASGSAGPAAHPTARTTLDSRHYVRGDCYLWNQGVQNAAVGEVSCDSPHLFESVTSDVVDIASDHPLGDPFPSDPEWEAIDKRYCLATAEQYLGYPLDPHGRFEVGSIHPTGPGWQTGDRWLNCGLTASIPSVTSTPYTMDLFSGLVRGADQSFTYPAGACILDPGQDGAKVVSCAGPHQYVATGDVHLAATANGAPPADSVYELQCLTVARTYLGASWQPSDTVQAGWFPIQPESWKAGSHTATCAIRYVTAAGEPRTVTGDQLHLDPGRPA